MSHNIPDIVIARAKLWLFFYPVGVTGRTGKPLALTQVARIVKRAEEDAA